MNGYTVRSTTMLSGPAFNSPAVQRPAGNVGITVYGCLRGWSWCEISDYASRGWVAGNGQVPGQQRMVVLRACNADRTKIKGHRIAVCDR